MMSASEEGAAVLTLATLNLYHWAEPGIGWYEPGRGHDAESWAAKRAWLAAILDEMQPDLVGFQEVVSVAALREDCAAAGLTHFATIAEPKIRVDEEGAGERYYVRPVQAVASRWPINASEVEANPDVSGALGVSSGREFRRPAIRAEIEPPQFGPAVVYTCHLKSPGVGVEDALISGAHLPPEEPEALGRWTLEALSRAHAAAAIQRQFEASQLYHAAVADIAAAPDRPVAILGDFNAEPGSPALRAMTPFAAFERDGGAHGAGEEEEEAKAKEAADAAARYRLVDAFRLGPRSLFGDERRPTHRSGAAGEVLDFILVSAALQPGDAPPGALRVTHRTHDRHFRGGDPAESSDHAGVSARFERAGGS